MSLRGSMTTSRSRNALASNGWLDFSSHLSLSLSMFFAGRLSLLAEYENTIASWNNSWLELMKLSSFFIIHVYYLVFFFSLLSFLPQQSRRARECTFRCLLRKVVLLHGLDGWWYWAMGLVTKLRMVQQFLDCIVNSVWCRCVSLWHLTLSPLSLDSCHCQLVFVTDLSFNSSEKHHLAASNSSTGNIWCCVHGGPLGFPSSDGNSRQRFMGA